MPASSTRGAASPDRIAESIRAGDRPSLARAITLIESRREDDLDFAYEVLRLLMPDTGKSHRMAISGPPGAGKSTLIDAYGLRLVEGGHRVAVLAVDPSSSLSGGSILGDKSRMPSLARHDRAFIRPSPTDLALGGVTRRTREALFLCEAAGFDRIVIETVGVGQSEIQVAGMVDTFVVLVQPGAGDELQGIKKGVVELADLLVVSKTDGANIGLAREASAQYSAALKYLRQRSSTWQPRVVNVSALSGEGVAELEGALAEHHAALATSDELATRRRSDLETWLGELTEAAVLRRTRSRDDLPARIGETVTEVAGGEASAYRAALELARLPPS